MIKTGCSLSSVLQQLTGKCNLGNKFLFIFGIWEMKTSAETAQIPVGSSPIHRYSIVHTCRYVNTT